MEYANVGIFKIVYAKLLFLKTKVVDLLKTKKGWEEKAGLKMLSALFN
jgi:hypothetical protein